MNGHLYVKTHRMSSSEGSIRGCVPLLAGFTICKNYVSFLTLNSLPLLVLKGNGATDKNAFQTHFPLNKQSSVEDSKELYI